MSNRKFKSESEFQNAVMKSLKIRGFTAIHSGTGSAIDEYVVYPDDPFKVIALIDFKYQSKRTDGSNEPVNLTSNQAKVLSSRWANRFLFVIYTINDNFLIINNKGIIPLVSDYYSKADRYKTSHSINLSPKRFKRQEAKNCKRDGHIQFHEKFGQLIEGLVNILNSFMV